jgi:hypothetical protein
MKFTLNIYKKKEVVKTYDCDSYDLMFGTLEDFLNILDLETLTGDISDTDFIKLVTVVITKSLGELKPLLMDVFDGLTEEELRQTKVKELIAVMIQIVMYSISEIKGVANSKN